MFKKLKKLKRSGNARLEYQCGDCGYMLYRPLIGEDIERYLNNWEASCLIACPSCRTRTMKLIFVWSEKDWIKHHKYGEI